MFWKVKFFIDDYGKFVVLLLWFWYNLYYYEFILSVMLWNVSLVFDDVFNLCFIFNVIVYLFLCIILYLV